ncbi:tetratricopeptide repeat protein [Nonomuraea sp. NPDC005692]|uniref:tetratricopeptide repeat protein n=1 Tax=Nonomuraea sp. NPDC005692 TaxID=3157168 RepID=UPI0033F3B335
MVQRPGRAVEMLQPSGTLNPGDRHVGDRYLMTVTGAAPATRADGSSPWGGLSGAALFCDDLLTGVMTTDPAGWRHGRLEAVPAYVLHHDAGFRRLLAAEGVATDLELIEYQDLAAPAELPADGRSLAALLRARLQVVPFHGREQTLQTLQRWAGLPGFGAHLVHGSGGQGKTRLATEFATRLRRQGWAVLWLGTHAADVGLAALKDAATPLLIVIDYAESRLSQLIAVLEAAARHAEATPLKVLLLARTAGSWWVTVQAASAQAEALLDGTPFTTLPALGTLLDDRITAYRQASRAFAEELARTRPGPSWPTLRATLPAPPAAQIASGNALTMHMTALVDLLDAAQPELAAKITDAPDTTGAGFPTAPAHGVEDRLLVHERRYWETTAITYSLHTPGRLLQQRLEDALVAAIALGAEDELQADALLARVPALAKEPQRADRDQIRSWIAALYPSGSHYAPWGELQPDRLAERFLGRHVLTHPALFEALLDEATTAQVTRLLIMATRAAAHPSFGDALAGHVIGWCLNRPDALIGAVIQVVTQVEAPAPLLQALQQLLDRPTTTPADLVRWAGELPTSSYVLAEWAVHLTERLAHYYRSQDDQLHLAVSLNNQSNWLGDLGQREKALKANSGALQIYRRLAEARPDLFLLDLATSLNNQSIRLAALGRHEEALEVVTEAVAIRRRLAEVDASLPQLAVSLNNQSVALGDLGRCEEALEVVTEAVAIRRRLAEVRPDSFLPDLAASLNNQSIQLGALGRGEEALEAVVEALQIYRRLAEVRPDAFLPNLAGSLHNQSIRLGALGRGEEALEVVTEAVAIRRRLAEVRPDAYLPDFASSLNSQSNRLGALGRREEALQASVEVLQIYRRVTEVRPEAFLPALAASLNNHSNRLGALGRGEEALEAVVEALQIYRRLTEVRPDAFHSDLAGSLNNQFIRLGALGRREEALQASVEALQIYRRLAEVRPEAFLPALAMSLNNYSVALGELGRREEALEAVIEAVAIRRRLAKARPDAHQRQLQQSLRVLAWLQRGDG